MQIQFLAALFILINSGALLCMEMDEYPKPTAVSTKNHCAADDAIGNRSSTPPLQRKKFSEALKKGGITVLAAFQSFSESPFWLDPTAIVPCPDTFSENGTPTNKHTNKRFATSRGKEEMK